MNPIKWLISLVYPFHSLGRSSRRVYRSRQTPDAADGFRLREEEYRILIQHSGKSIVRYDLRTGCAKLQADIPANGTIPSVLKDIPRSLLDKGIIAQESSEDLFRFFECMHRGEPSGSVMLCTPSKDGKRRWMHADFTLLYDAKKNPWQSIISFYDMTMQREKELAYQKWLLSHRRSTAESISYYEFNLTCNRLEHAEGHLFPPDSVVIAETPEETSSRIVNQWIYPCDREAVMAFFNRERLLSCFAAHESNGQLQCRGMNADGQAFWMQLSIQLLADPYNDDVKCLLLYEDIDCQKRAELLTHERMNNDTLTGLLNRTAFTEQMNHLLHASTGQRHALIMIDVDGFKRVNDVFGHRFGDTVLAELAAALRATLRSDDLIGRLGGDEYVAFLRNIPTGDSFLKKKMPLHLPQHEPPVRRRRGRIGQSWCCPCPGTWAFL